MKVEVFAPYGTRAECVGTHTVSLELSNSNDRQRISNKSHVGGKDKRLANNITPPPAPGKQGIQRTCYLSLT